MFKLAVIVWVSFIIILSFFYLYLHIKSYFNYSNLLEIMRSVDNKCTNYMNYGFWEKDTDNLEQASINLIEYVYNIGELHKFKNVLDVGCGNAEQDIKWLEMDKYNGNNLNITCIDLDEKMIENAKKNILDNNLEHRIKVYHGNACNLEFQNSQFDCIVSLESAFHYKPRMKFLEESHRILKKDGTLLLVDIIGNKPKTVMNSLYQSFLSNLLDIPKANMVSENELNNQLNNIGFDVELYNITDNVFTPFYKNFFKKLHFNCGYVTHFWEKISDLLINNYITDSGDLLYIIAVCKKI